MTPRGLAPQSGGGAQPFRFAVAGVDRDEALAACAARRIDAVVEGVVEGIESAAIAPVGYVRLALVADADQQHERIRAWMREAPTVHPHLPIALCPTLVEVWPSGYFDAGQK